MRVLMFGWEFPPHISGGLGTACYGLTRGMVMQHLDVIFVVPKMYGDEVQEDLSLISAEDVPVTILEKDVQYYHDHFKYIEVSSAMVPYMDPEEYRRVHESTSTSSTSEDAIRWNQKMSFQGGYKGDLLGEVARYALIGTSLGHRETFDLIHAHDWLTYPAGIAAKNASGKPLVIHVHATEYDRSGENVNTEVYQIEKMGMKAADLVITVSNLTRNIVVDRYGIDPDKVFTVHNAVDFSEGDSLGEIKRYTPEKIVTFLGRITYQKGPEYFIEAAKKVLEREPNVRFVMAGSGDMMNKMIRRVAELGISMNFHFTGFLTGDDVPTMFRMSDVYVMPSVSEPFGISPLEAMRSNVPVIISKQSGVAEILDHAIKVDFWDVDAIADAIYAILKYPALTKTFKKHGQDEVHTLKWENAAHEVKKLYEKLLYT